MKNAFLQSYSINNFFICIVGILSFLVLCIGFNPQRASAMPMGTIACNAMGGTTASLEISANSDWGGLLGGVGVTPAQPGDGQASLEGTIPYTTAEPAGSHFFIFDSLTPGATYTFTLELSDSTVIDTVDCTTSTIVHAVTTDLQLFSVNGVEVNANEEYYNSATSVPQGADLVYRYYITNIGPVSMTMTGNNGTDPAILADDYIISFTDQTGSSELDRYIEGDTNTNNDLDPGETWILEEDRVNIQQSYEDQDSSDLINDTNPDTAIPTVQFLARDDPAWTSKSFAREFIQIESADLALRKTTTSTNVTPGQDVTFTIDVFNQGGVDAYDIELVDYIQNGFTLSDNDTNGWVESGDMATVTLAGPITAGNNTSIDIVLTVDSPWTISDFTLLNYAEIKSAEDFTSTSLVDIDSTADMDDNNDCGAEVNTANDDRLDGDGMAGAGCDEDDHDVEDVTVLLEPSIDIEKLVGYPDGDLLDADTEEERVAVATGADATITILVTNTGTTDLTLNDGQPAVDANCTNLTIYDRGDNDSLNILSVGEVWTYTCIVEDIFEPGTCDASIVANPVFPDGSDIPGLSDVTDSDPIFLDIGGNLFGATVSGELADTGISVLSILLGGAVVIVSSLYVKELTGAQRFYYSARYTARFKLPQLLNSLPFMQSNAPMPSTQSTAYSAPLPTHRATVTQRQVVTPPVKKEPSHVDRLRSMDGPFINRQASVRTKSPRNRNHSANGTLIERRMF